LQRQVAIVQLRSDQNLKHEYMSVTHGAIYSCWPGAAHGRGCNRLVLDDVHSPAEAWSDTERETTLQFVRGSLFSRLDDPAHDAIVVCHSRLHEDDLIGQLRNPPREETRSAEQSMEAIASAVERAPELVVAPDEPCYIPGAPRLLPCFRPPWMW
jgi:hypothetical protein